MPSRNMTSVASLYDYDLLLSMRSAAGQFVKPPFDRLEISWLPACVLADSPVFYEVRVLHILYAISGQPPKGFGRNVEAKE